jgi:hypothetical protein
VPSSVSIMRRLVTNWRSVIRRAPGSSAVAATAPSANWLSSRAARAASPATAAVYRGDSGIRRLLYRTARAGSAPSPSMSRQARLSLTPADSSVMATISAVIEPNV